MDRVYEELDEAKVEIEKLRAEYRIKVELSDSLKRAHSEQLIKIQEASTKIEKQAQELDEQAYEISVVKQKYEDLKCRLKEKEAIVKHLSSANEKLRLDCDEKFRKWEEENRDLVLALDEANAKNMDQEQNTREFKEEIEGLKQLVSVSQKKCLEAEKKAKGSKELRQRDDMLFKLEEENRKVEEQLKWKKEQFKHLEEAHEKLRDQFRTSKKEWELEKSTLIDEISTLQTNLDSQTRISEGLQSRLKMCNQALAHEESRRKLLEVQLSESKRCFENIFGECQEANLKVECLTSQRDKDIAALRDLLGTKEAHHKETEYRVGKLEQENQELRLSLKELQEAQIQEAGSSSSLSKLRNKLKGLEQIHRDCSKNLRAKEAEWSSQLEKMAADLNECSSELESKDTVIKELKMELEGCRSSMLQLELQNEETSLMLLALKSGISEARFNLANEKASMDLRDNEREDNVSLLSSQLEKMAVDLNECRSELQSKDTARKELGLELEGCYSSMLQLELQNEETSLMLLALKSGISEARLNLDNEKTSMDLRDNEREDNVSLLSSQLEKMAVDLSECRSELQSKDTAIKELKLELEGCHSSMTQLELQNEETSLMLLALKSGMSEARFNLANEKASVDLRDNEREDSVSLLSSQLEKMAVDLNECRSELQGKDTAIKELKMELEGCHSSMMQLELQNEETSIMLLALTSGISEARLNLANEKASMDLRDNEREDNVSLLMKQLEMKNSALVKAQTDVEEEHEKVASLSRKVESLNFIEQQQLQLQEELERHKEMVKESSGHQLHLKEQALRLKNDLTEVCDALDRANNELAQKFCEGNELEFELQIWKSIAERLKANLEEKYHMRREVESSLLAQVEVEVALKQEKEILARALEERDKRLNDLQQQLVLLDGRLNTRETEIGSPDATMETAMASESEKESLLQRTKEMEKISEDHQKEVEWLEQEWVKRELEGAILAQIDAESYEHEKNYLHQLVGERDQRIDDLQQVVRSLEEKVNSSATSFLSQLAEAQAEINLLWEKTTTTEILKEIEIQVKILIIAGLEDDLSNMQKKLELQERTLSSSEEKREEIEAELEAKQLEIKKLTYQLETELRTSDALIQKLESEKKILLEDVKKLLSERESLLDFIGDQSERISELSSKDMQLMGIWGRIMQTVDNHGMRIDLKGGDELFDPVKENINVHPSPTAKKVDAILDERSPLRALNS
ncbi:hypothetical protein F0562_005476 [Nyssa sinensis]|uniref:Uncharacterized protein n=1 Tax=Nyssa sinensis TaxID=561372 RepID=A0A5J5AM70_9ASTE|nr:hypothetical protein F0562_005476 [Nyssa sinensis]